MSDSPPASVRVGTILVCAAAALWALTFAWMWVPFYAWQAEGQLYALFPIALMAEAMVVILAFVGVVIAIVDAVPGRARRVQTVVCLVVGLSMLTFGPVLLWFGTIPI